MPRPTLLTLLTAFALVAPAAADPVPDPAGDVAHPDGLSGRDIYERVVAHRLRSFYAEAELENGNGHGDSRTMRFVMLWKDYRKEDPKLLSLTRIELIWPFDLRFGGLKIEKKRHQPAQQWAYVPEFRWIRRVSLRGVPVHGSCFTFDDIVPPETDEFRYRRLADDVDGGRPVYVVELYPKPNAASEHSRIVVSIDRAREIPVRSRYWNAAGELTKELRLPPARVEEFDGSWFPMLWDMRSVSKGCFSTIRVGRFVANPELGPRAFDLGRLESH